MKSRPKFRVHRKTSEPLEGEELSTTITNDQPGVILFRDATMEVIPFSDIERVELFVAEPSPSGQAE